MNKYEYIATELNNRLGTEFNIVYNNDESIEWDKILIDNVINGVMHSNSGNFTKTNGVSVYTNQLSINLMIPTIVEVFSSAIQTVEDTFKNINNEDFEFDNERIKLTFNYMSDSNRVVINGVDYANIIVYINLISFKNALMFNNSSITINSVELNGVFHATYMNNHTSDAVVKGNVDLVQTNRVNSIQKSLTIDAFVIQDDNLIKQLMLDEDSNIKYNISYFNGVITRTINNAYLISLTEDGLFNDLLKIKLAFGVGD